MKPNLVIRPSFTVVGMKYHGKNQHNEIPQLWGKFGPHMHEVNHVIHPEVSYGVMDNFDEESGEFDYMAACEVNSLTDIATSMTLKVIPAQTYAVFPCTMASLKQTYEMICQKWLPTSGYHRGDGPEFELYNEHFDPLDINSEMFIYIPVEADGYPSK